MLVFSFKNFITNVTIYFGGISTNICMCSKQTSTSIIVIPFHSHNCLNILLLAFRKSIIHDRGFFVYSSLKALLNLQTVYGFLTTKIAVHFILLYYNIYNLLPIDSSLDFIFDKTSFFVFNKSF